MHCLTTPWRDFPGQGADGHVFAIADVHGRADLLGFLLDHLQGLPAEGPRTLVFTGDIVDRGPQNLASCRLALDAGTRFERRIFLPGNHEGYMMSALLWPLENANLKFWHAVGGEAMFDEIVFPPGLGGQGLARKIRDALPEGFVDLVLSAPSHHVSGDLIFVHAGLAPLRPRETFLSLGLFDYPADGHHWNTVRDVFLNWTRGWDAPERVGPTVVVHGHSVEIEARSEIEGELLAAIDRVADRRRINLDIGAYCFGQMAALEAVGKRYRFHIAHAPARALG